MCDCQGYSHHRDCLFFDELIDDDSDIMLMSSNGDAQSTAIRVLGGSSALYQIESCHHDLDEVTLPSGLTLYASAWSAVAWKRDYTPDVGVYFDSSWMPTDCFSYMIGWQDYGLPTVPAQDVVRLARAVLNHAEWGEVVEVGCLGAHGRTGTFLAICTILDSPSYGYKRAIAHVRDNHCKKAVETQSQETYVKRISGMLRRGEV
jgi:hypothetical protein